MKGECPVAHDQGSESGLAGAASGGSKDEIIGTSGFGHHAIQSGQWHSELSTDPDDRQLAPSYRFIAAIPCQIEIAFACFRHTQRLGLFCRFGLFCHGSASLMASRHNASLAIPACHGYYYYP